MVPEKSICVSESVPVAAATPDVEATVSRTLDSMVWVPRATLTCVEEMSVLPSAPV